MLELLGQNLYNLRLAKTSGHTAVACATNRNQRTPKKLLPSFNIVTYIPTCRC